MPALGNHPQAANARFAETWLADAGGFPRLDDTGNHLISLRDGAVIDTASLLLDGDSCARVAGNLGLGYPFTFATQVWCPASAVFAVMSASWADSDFHYLGMGSGRSVRGETRASPGASAVESSVDVLPAGVWLSIGYVCLSATNRQLWAEGSFRGTDATNLTPTGTAERWFTIGGVTRGSGVLAAPAPAGTRVRYTMVWDGVRSGAQLNEWMGDPTLPYTSVGTSGNANGVILNATASLIAGAATGPLGTLNFQAAGMEFGRRTGLALSTFALEANVSYRYTVHSNALVLGAPIFTSGVVSTDSSGRLPNASNAAFVTGQTVWVCAVRQADGQRAIFPMVVA